MTAAPDRAPVPEGIPTAAHPEVVGRSWSRLFFPLLIVAGCAVAFHEVIGYWFTGQDALPLILSARPDSLAHVARLFHEEFLSAYSGRDIAGSIGFRPIGMLSFAADYRLWGLDPFGYHLTNLCLHAANGVLLYALGRLLKPAASPLVSLLAAALFVVHPIHARTVPVIPVRFDLLLGAFTLLFLHALIRYLRTSRVPYLLAALACAVLAMGAKETAVALVPMAMVSALILAPGSPRPGRRVLVAVGAVTLVVCATLVYRQMVLSGLGGYPRDWRPFPQGLVWGAYLFLEPLLLRPALFSSARLDLAARVVVSGLFGVALLVLSIRGLALALRPRDRQRAGDPDLLATAGALWTLCLMALYIAIYQITGVLQLWYLYVPAMTTSLVLAFAVGRLVTEIVGRRARLGRVRRRRATVGAAVAGTLVATGLVLSPPTSSGLGEWGRASRLAHRYLDGFGASLERVPDASTVALVDLPYGYECSGRCIARATILADYTVDAWIRLTGRGRSINVGAASRLWLSADEPPPVSTITVERNAGSAIVECSSGTVVPARYSLLRNQLQVVVPEEPPSRRTDLTVNRGRSGSGGIYLFDLFSPRMLVELESAASARSHADPGS